MDYTFRGTPGPWSYKETTAGKHKAVDRNGFSVATTPGYDKGCKADAHLISAAPDLLQVAINALNDMRTMVPKSAARDARIFQIENVLNKALNLQP
jgi:hypothetical protein